MKFLFSAKAVVLFSLCVILLFHTAHAFHVKESTVGSGNTLDGVDLKAAFELFKSTYARVYTTAREEAIRMNNFVMNYKNMLQQRAANPHAKFGVNYLFDRSQEEMFRSGALFFQQEQAKGEAQERAGLDTLEGILKRREGRRQDEKRSARAVLREVCAHTEDDVDWRKCDAVSAVKDQGSCGSCWSFSAVGNIESQWYLNRLAVSQNSTSEPLVRLSEQHLVSCDDLDSACMGGLMTNAYTWLLSNTNGYLYTEDSYPYVSGSGEVPECIDHNRTLGAFITSHITLEQKEEVMEAYLREHGPLAIAVDATSFLSYHSGILTECTTVRLNHGVLLVGYHNAEPAPEPVNVSLGEQPRKDENDNVSYWIIKNSWGESWGEDGYIRVKKGVNACMMNEYVVTALVDHNAPEPPEPSTHAPPTTPRPRPTPSPGSYYIVHTECKDYACTGDTCQSEELVFDKCAPYGIRDEHDGYYVRTEYAQGNVILHLFADENCSMKIRVKMYTTYQCYLRLDGSYKFTLNQRV